jgi:hypothetical protein
MGGESYQRGGCCGSGGQARTQVQEHLCLTIQAVTQLTSYRRAAPLSGTAEFRFASKLDTTFSAERKHGIMCKYNHCGMSMTRFGWLQALSCCTK